MECYVFRWDWKGYPPMEDIIQTTEKLVKKKKTFWIIRLEEIPNYDESALILSSKDLNRNQAIKLFELEINK